MAKYDEFLEQPSDAKRWKVALYIRLSKEDGDKGESYSVTSQREILLEYLKSHSEFELYDIYVDDGWSGTNFDRPDFKRMMDDVYEGKVNCIVVKDLSRFGRNYADAGNYIASAALGNNENGDYYIMEGTDSKSWRISKKVPSADDFDFAPNHLVRYCYLYQLCLFRNCRGVIIRIRCITIRRRYLVDIVITIRHHIFPGANPVFVSGDGRKLFSVNTNCSLITGSVLDHKLKYNIF